MDHSMGLDRPPSSKRRAKFLAGGALVALVLVVLVVWAMTRAGATAFYLTTSELVARGPTAAGEEVDVNGKVAPGSIEEDGLVTTFTLSDGDAEIVVTTDQETPDAFRVGADVVAHGTYDGRTFEADHIVAKCPSKFEPASG
jgi:cytochrome c-type biogenesis protein CcmE